MKKYTILLLSAFLLFNFNIANGSENLNITEEIENAKLESMSSRYLGYLYTSFPEEGTKRGLRDSSEKLNDRTLDSDKKRLNNLEAFLESLETINYENLSAEKKVEYNIIKQKAQLAIFTINKQQNLKKNPYIYISAVDSIYDLYMDRGLTERNRAKGANARIKQLPETLELAKENLYKPSHFLTSITIQKAKKAYNSMDELEPFLRKYELDDYSKEEVVLNLQETKKQIENFRTFLSKDILVKPDTDYRLGEQDFMSLIELKYHTDIEQKKLAKLLESYYFETKENLLANIRIMLDIKDEAPASLTNLKEAKKVAINYPKNDEIIPTYVRIYKEALNHFKSLNILPPVKQNIKIEKPPIYYTNAKNPVFYFKPFEFYNIGDIVLYLSLPESFKNEENKLLAKEKFSYSNIKVMVAKYMVPGTHLKNSYGSKANLRKMSEAETMLNGWQLYALHLAGEFNFTNLKTEKFFLSLEQYTIATKALTSFKLHTKEFNSKDAIGLLQSATVSKSQAMYYLQDIAINPVKDVSFVLGYEDILNARAEYEEKFGTLLKFHEQLLGLDNIPTSYLDSELERIYKEEKKNRKN